VAWDIKSLLETYLENVRPSGDNAYRTQCPCSQARPRSFWVHGDSGYFRCFSCDAHGSIRRLLKDFIGLPDDSVRDLISKVVREPLSAVAKAKRVKKAPVIIPEYVLGAWENFPIQLEDAGFTEDTIWNNDVGYDEDHDRITFPIRDVNGNLVAISGRACDDSRVGSAYPRYKVYDSSPKHGELKDVVDELYIPDNRAHLYGMHTAWLQRTKAKRGDDLPPLIIVEGFKGCLWLRQLGFPHTVAMMGDNMSKEQERLLSRLPGPYYLFLDHEPGQQLAEVRVHWKTKEEDWSCHAMQIAKRLMKYDRVFLLRYPPNAQERDAPDDLTRDEVDWSLENKETVAQLIIRTGKEAREKGLKRPVRRRSHGIR